MFWLIAIDFSQKSPHFSLLSLTPPCELSEREVTSPSNLKVVGVLDNYFLVFVIFINFFGQLEDWVLFLISCPKGQVEKYVIFLSNYWWQESDIWSKASYRYAILWEAFLDPSDSYFLFADLVGFYTHWTYMHIFRHIFLSNYWWHESDIWSQASYWYPISWESFLDPSDSYFLFVDLIFIHIEHICSYFVTFFSANIDGRNLIFGHKL